MNKILNNIKTTNKPNLFFVGFPKCGTTLLYEYLKLHPKITVSLTKEPKFFAKDLIDENKKFSKVKITLIENEKQYLELFQKNNIYLADFSPQHSYSKLAPKNIYEFNKQSKMIIIFREPVSFLYSLHAQNIQNSYEKETNFLKALKLEKVRKKDKKYLRNVISPKRLFYSELIKYSLYLQNYLNEFPKEQINIFFFEELKKDNQKIVDEICEFLNIETIKIERKKVNVRTKIKFRKIRYFIRSSIVPIISPIFQKLFSMKTRRKLNSIFNQVVDKFTLQEDKTSKIDPKLKKELMIKFKPEVVKLNELLHKEGFVEKDFDLLQYWGYDKI